MYSSSIGPSFILAWQYKALIISNYRLFAARVGWSHNLIWENSQTFRSLTNFYHQQNPVLVLSYTTWQDVQVLLNQQTFARLFSSELLLSHRDRCAAVGKKQVVQTHCLMPRVAARFVSKLLIESRLPSGRPARRSLFKRRAFLPVAFAWHSFWLSGHRREKTKCEPHLTIFEVFVPKRKRFYCSDLVVRSGIGKIFWCCFELCALVKKAFLCLQ